MEVPFLDLRRHHEALREVVLAAWANVYDSGRFVSGERVQAFESAFAGVHETEYAVATSSGTSALELIMRALGMGRGHKVVVPVNTFIASAAAVSNVGATPVFVDCDESGLIDVEQAVAALAQPGVKAVMPVHLYGHPADMEPITEAADRLGIAVVEDAAQAHLARYRERSVGGLGAAAAFSFYPGKNLGAPGEGGAITTNDPVIASRVRKLRDHGQADKYYSDLIGTNARMTELVAAMLELKLPRLEEVTEARRRVADRYRGLLEACPAIDLPSESSWARSVYHLYVIHCDRRDAVRDGLSARGIATGLHYPVPLHRQAAYRDLGYDVGDFPVAERKADRLISLPMFPELTDEEIEAVATAVLEVVGDVDSDG